MINLLTSEFNLNEEKNHVVQLPSLSVFPPHIPAVHIQHSSAKHTDRVPVTVRTLF